MRERGQRVEAPLSFGEEVSPLDDEVPRMSRFSPVALVWVLLFVVGTLYRACTSG